MCDREFFYCTKLRWLVELKKLRESGDPNPRNVEERRTSASVAGWSTIVGIIGAHRNKVKRLFPRALRQLHWDASKPR